MALTLESYSRATLLHRLMKIIQWHGFTFSVYAPESWEGIETRNRKQEHW